MKIISQNIRSINANFDKLLDTQTTINADLILLQECWQPKKDYLMDGFDQIMTLRKDKNGGGVAIFYRKSFKCRKIKELISANVELLIAEITINSGKNKSEHKLLITSFYIPPQADKKQAISVLQSELELAQIGKYKVTIVTGDANIDTINSIKNTAQNDKILLMNMAFDLNLDNINDKLPTRVSDNRSSCIDHMMVRSSGVEVKRAGVLATEVSDHLALFLSLDISNDRRNRKRRIKVLNEAHFLQKVAGMDWRIINESNDMEDNVKTFSSRIEEAILENTHERTLNKHVTNQPWFTKSIKCSKYKKLRYSRNGWKVRP